LKFFTLKPSNKQFKTASKYDFPLKMPIKWPIGKCHAPPKNFGNVQNSGGAWHRLSLTSLSDNGRFDGW
uniref:hypothetical protein n=1 Tax=Candidatus Cryptobacteroides bacterium TaxID=3085639 RepID=UPI004027A4C4